MICGKFAAQISFFVGIIFFVSSCLKAPSQTEDHGPTVPTENVQKAIADAWGNVDPADIRKDEFMFLEQDQKISTLDPRVVYKESTQVLDRIETVKSYDYKLLLRSTTLDEDGNFKPVTSTEQEISVNKSTAAKDEAMLSSAPALPTSLEALQKSMKSGSVGLYESEDGRLHERALGLQTVISLYEACVKATGWDVSCHNLQLTEGVMPPPTGVSSKPNCGGIVNCQVAFKKVSFDLVVSLTDEEGTSHVEKVVYEITVSPQLPYLSRLTEFCYQGLVKASGQRILVKVCNKVKNFEVGTNP